MHLVNFDRPGGAAGITPMLARAGQAAERAGVANLSAMDHYLQIAAMGVDGANAPMLEGEHHPRLPRCPHRDRRTDQGGAELAAHLAGYAAVGINEVHVVPVSADPVATPWAATSCQGTPVWAPL
ncbi:hypothetical protein [Ornithinimicrobium cerasi]|uniref:Uncharacterized protein n=1 Tax=Ornithinimicrobium cerasi TaxID=2248773 RepID=A0A285VWT6_9MICO|nr:hypothetical protein [Ornithinimicrobium cerasi]SOC57716.1 hypothetical protein SAMN05421879_11533 [Ornithinimicrobium cerasi]